MSRSVATINCLDHANGCTRGLFGGSPSPGICEHVCTERRPEFDGPAVTWQAGVSVCRDRLLEEWSPEWREKLLASAMLTTPRRIVVPPALYEESLKSRT